MIISLDLSGTNIKVEKLSPAQSVTADFNQVYFRTWMMVSSLATMEQYISFPMLQGICCGIR